MHPMQKSHPRSTCKTQYPTDPQDVTGCDRYGYHQCFKTGLSYDVQSSLHLNHQLNLCLFEAWSRYCNRCNRCNRRSSSCCEHDVRVLGVSWCILVSILQKCNIPNILCALRPTLNETRQRIQRATSCACRVSNPLTLPA